MKSKRANWCSSADLIGWPKLPNTTQSGASQGRLCTVLSPGICNIFQHWVPGAAQNEATVSIKIPGMKPDLDDDGDRDRP
jgi:hypothetical protein